MTSRVVAVLGMHRSGTSWLTGSLQHAGLELGDVSTANEHNRKGNRESPLLIELHEAVLADNGGSWDDPHFPNAWSPERSAELAQHISDMNARAPLWGFKDPRALFLLDEWNKQVGDLIRIGIYRHPLSVYQSLRNRQRNFPKRKAIALWIAYNERLLAEHARDSFPMIRFDVPTDRLIGQQREAIGLVGLPDAPEGFFDAGLVHNNNVADAPVPRRARAMWAALGDIALAPR